MRFTQTDGNTATTLPILQRKLARETRARQEAEFLLEKKTSELFSAHCRLEEELNRARDLATAIETSTDGVAFTDSDGVFRYMNTSHAEMFGYDVTELIGQSWSVLYSDDVLSVFNDVIMPTFFKEGAWRGEADGVTKSGQPLPQEISLTKLPTGGILCTTRDITERRRRENTARELAEKLRHAEQQSAVLTLTNSLTHDFNNLISAIAGYAHLLHTDSENMPKTKERAYRIQQATEKAADLVKSLEERGEDGLQECSILDLRAVVKECLDIAEAIKPIGVSISTDFPDFAFVYCNEMLLSRSILNIIKNAFEVIEPGTSIHLRIGRDSTSLPGQSSCAYHLGDQYNDHAWVLEIIDRGPGLHGSQLAEIFNPGFSTKSRLRNSGLGLFSLTRLADSQMAAVSVESQVGYGTLFRLGFPIIESQGPKSDPRQDIHSVDVRSDGYILVVDDDHLVGEMLAETLQSKGYPSVWVSEPSQALQRIRENPEAVSALITDYNMPQMNGVQLVKEVTPLLERKIPILICSGQPIPRRLPPSVDKTMRKPISIAELTDTLSALLPGMSKSTML